MSLKVSVKELLVAMPVLNAISKAKLPAFGAMKVAEVVKAAADEINIVYEARNTRLAELAEKGEDGKLRFTTERNDEGAEERVPVFKGEQEEQQFNDFWYALQDREVTLPYTLKPKHFEPTLNRPGSGYELSALDVIRLGKILSHVGLPPEEDAA